MNSNVEKPDTDRRPSVCVIVLNYNGREHLTYALPSILATAYPALKVLLVDNASSDNSTAFVAQNFPGVEILQTGKNLGWSGGNNIGIRHALRGRYDFIVLANNDIRVDPRWMSVAVSAARADERTGIIGFRIMEPRGADRDAGFTHAMQSWTTPHVHDAEAVDGMAMFVRAQVFRRIGLIDEGFFAYAEDNDFERRVRKGGYRIIATDVPVWHYGRGSFGKIPVRAGVLQIRNNLRLSLKHDGPAGWLYQLIRHFLKGCIPFWPIDRTDARDQRLHPSNFLVNTGIYIYAIAWNLYHVRVTWRQRRHDRRREARARRQWEAG